MRIFILEDDRGREEAIREALRKRFGDGIGIVSAASAGGARRILEKSHRNWDALFLDHDLAGILLDGDPDPGNGQDVARAIVELGVTARVIVIQSVNTDGAQKIKGILNAAGYEVLLAPYNTGQVEEPETIRLIEKLK